jgi:hypothetical protein
VTLGLRDLFNKSAVLRVMRGGRLGEVMRARDGLGGEKESLQLQLGINSAPPEAFQRL